MRQFAALRRARRHLRNHRECHTPRTAAKLLASLAMACLVTGCLAHAPPPPQEAQSRTIPKPRASLMTKQHEPQCLYTEAANAEPTLQKAVAKVSDAQSEALVKPVAMATSDDAAERRERERDCFRDAEARVRKQLTQLQAAVRTTLRAVDQKEDALPHR